MRIHLIEDDNTTNQLHAMLFELFPNISAEFYVTGADYLEHLQTHEEDIPHFVFVDIRLPEFSGLDLIEKIIQSHFNQLDNARIFVLSSTLLRHDIERAKSFNIVEDFIEKPLTHAKIKELLA